MRSRWWCLPFCLLAACGGESESRDEGGDDSSDATGGTSGTGGSATGGGAGTAGTAGGPAQWAVVCSRSADVSCRKWVECLPYLAETTLPSDCVGSLLTECLSFAGLPDVTLVPSEFLACVEAFDALSCDDWLYGGLFFRCEGLSGTRPDGSACGSPLQCASGACSVNLGCGVCETPSTEGESCAERQCATGLECGPGAICFEPRFLGDPCSDDAPCTQVLTCVGGACAKRGSEGTPCAGGALECDLLQGLTCGENLRCEPIAIPGIGEACTGFCATGAACDATGRCVPALMNGERCSLDGSGFNLCDDSLECIDGVCAQFDPASCG